jgi:VanZ family protein
MSSKRRGPGFWIGAWWPVAAAIAVILCESTEYFGAEYTSGPLRRIWEFLFGHVGDTLWDQIHHLVRKTGHFLGYGVIGLAWLRAWWMTLPRSRFLTDATLALAGTAVLASWDEWHQSFLPNRTGSPWDVLLDCCGALTMQLLVYINMRLFRPKKLLHQS